MRLLEADGVAGLGAGSEDRTRDLKITNLALYQLSYPGGVIERRMNK